MKHSKGKNNASYIVVRFVLGLFFCACQPIAFASKETSMITLNTSLWQIIADTQSRPALKLKNVEADLGQQLYEKIEESNESVQFFAGKPVQLAQGITIGEIDLRLQRRQPAASQGLLVLQLEESNTCITLQQVKQHFPILTITDVPRGRSLEEAITHTAITPWGKVSFSFQEKKPECLAYVSLRPAPR